jgi:hypothetical protein
MGFAVRLQSYRAYRRRNVNRGEEDTISQTAELTSGTRPNCPIQTQARLPVADGLSLELQLSGEFLGSRWHPLLAE